MPGTRSVNRRPIVGGNWKMQTTFASAEALALAVATHAASPPLASAVEIAVFPPFVYLAHVAMRLCHANSDVYVGAQDCWPEPPGAFTGEISVPQLKDVGCRYVLTGHSERRHVIGEDDALINRKTRAALDGGLRCILCVGETLAQREAGSTDDVNERQVRAGLAGVSSDAMDRVVIAYEPVWAIGTGRNATPADAQAAHARIRDVLADMFSPALAAAVRIQYGGSVKPDNAASLFAQPDIDGGLIGGASLKADDFIAICAAAVPRD